jgi:hypothetical protein
MESLGDRADTTAPVAPIRAARQSAETFVADSVHSLEEGLAGWVMKTLDPDAHAGHPCRRAKLLVKCRLGLNRFQFNPHPLIPEVADSQQPAADSHAAPKE